MHVVDQQLERARNFIDEEEIMKIAPIPEYLIYDVFGKYLDADIFYKRLMESTEALYMHLHVLIFISY